MTEISAISSADINPTLDSSDTAPVSRGMTLHDTDGSSNNTATVSFDDFLDMINPLEHIPLVSSIYRAVTGETINPVSRIAGDALYGGVFGLASAGISALGAVADEAFATINDGKSASTTIAEALFGKEGDSTTQLATATPVPDTATAAAAASTIASTPTAPTENAGAIGAIPAPPLLDLAALQTPARQSPILDMPFMTSSQSTVASIHMTKTVEATNPVAAPVATATTTAAETTPTPPTLLPTITPATSPEMLAQTVANAYASASNAKSNDPNTSKLRDAAAAANSTADPTLGLALNNGKLPYGGAMDTSLLQKAMENQTVALAMANNRNNIQNAHQIRNNRLAVSGEIGAAAAAVSSGGIPGGAASALPPSALTSGITSGGALLSTPVSPVTMNAVTAASPLTPTSPVASSDTASAPTDTAIPAPLMNDAVAMHNLNKYRHAAQSMPLPGASVNVTN